MSSLKRRRQERHDKAETDLPYYVLFCGTMHGMFQIAGMSAMIRWWFLGESVGWCCAGFMVIATGYAAIGLTKAKRLTERGTK